MGRVMLDTILPLMCYSLSADYLDHVHSSRDVASSLATTCRATDELN